MPSSISYKKAFGRFRVSFTNVPRHKKCSETFFMPHKGSCQLALFSLVIESAVEVVIVVVFGEGPARLRGGLANFVNLSCGVIRALSASGGGGICIQLYCRFSTGMPYLPASTNWPRKLSKQSKQTATISPFSIKIVFLRGLCCLKNGKSCNKKYSKVIFFKNYCY